MEADENEAVVASTPLRLELQEYVYGEVPATLTALVKLTV